VTGEAGSVGMPAGGSGGSGGSAAGGAGGSSSGAGGSVAAAGTTGASGSGSSGSGGGTVPASCGDVVDRVLVYNCGLGSGCHGAGARLGNFGESEAAALALVDKTATTSACKYIDTANPEKSAILDKLSPVPTCGGAQMPFRVDPLSQDDIDCVRSWVESL
jgi:hypothetical protein